MNNKLKSILTVVVIISFVFGALYWSIQRTNKRNIDRINLVNRDYEFSKGIITDIKYYKGRSIRIKYFIEDKSYHISAGWDNNPKSLDEGDSIKFRYSKVDPEVIINELEDEY